MGYYINPPDQTKEEFLEEHGKLIQPHAFREHWNFDGDLPVCLVDNHGLFTAAAIGYSESELREFSNPSDTRSKKFYVVPRSLLDPFLPESLRK